METSSAQTNNLSTCPGWCLMHNSITFHNQISKFERYKQIETWTQMIQPDEQQLYKDKGTGLPPS